MNKNLDIYFSGKKLYGDNFSSKQIKEWFENEKEGYSNLIDSTNYSYDCHELNKMYGYNKIKQIKKFKNVLGFGSAFGHELLPILDKIKNIIIIEPSKKLRSKSLKGKPVKYIKPNVNGKIDYPDNSFDLITCFGVLHHIPNVSYVIKELTRVLKKGGIMLIREPIISMGDWRKSRKGLTKKERGIPLDIFRRIIRQNSLRVISEKKILFPTTRRLKLGKKHACNSKFLVFLDTVLSCLFSWNDTYHAINFFHKLRPQAVFYVLKKLK